MEFEDRFEKLEAQIHSNQLLVKIVAAGFIIWLGAATYLDALHIPRYQKIFEEMLGAVDKLPGATRFIIGNAGLMMAMPIAFTVAGVISAFRIPNTLAIWIYPACLLCIIGIQVIQDQVLKSPLQQIFLEMAGG